jgi:CRISPR-associated protein Csm2
MAEISITTIMAEDPTGSGMVEFAKIKASLWKDLKRTQIRGIFSEAREIEANWKDDAPEKGMRRLNLLKAKLAYQQARHDKSEGMRGLVDTLTKAIDEVGKSSGAQQSERFHRFMELFEAILAYHRAYGGS